MSREKFFTKRQIEERALTMLARYSQQYEEVGSPPVPLDHIVEHLLDLKIVWAGLPADGDAVALGGLAPKARTIVLNETNLAMFEKTIGLENFTIAHEIGHWDLHFDENATPNLVLPDFEYPLEFICRSGDKSWDEKNADRYASYLLMPKKLILSAVKSRALTTWPTLYALRDLFKVSISALTIRLQELNLLYVDSEGNLYPSKQAYEGQTSLWA